MPTNKLFKATSKNIREVKWKFFQATAGSVWLYSWNTWRKKNLMGTTQGCCVVFWTNPGSNTLQNSSYMATNISSHKWSKISKTYSRSKDELISNVLLWTPTHGHTSVGWPAKTYIHQLCTETGYHRDDMLKVMTNRDGWWERVKKKCL